MTDKQKEILKKLLYIMKNMSDDELDNLLLVGEGMAMMTGIMSQLKEAEAECK